MTKTEIGGVVIAGVLLVGGIYWYMSSRNAIIAVAPPRNSPVQPSGVGPNPSGRQADVLTAPLTGFGGSGGSDSFRSGNNIREISTGGFLGVAERLSGNPITPGPFVPEAGSWGTLGGGSSFAGFGFTPRI